MKVFMRILSSKIEHIVLWSIIFIFFLEMSASAGYAEELQTAGEAVTDMFTQSGKEYFDKVRSLNDEELAEFINQFESEGNNGEKTGLEEWKSLKDSIGEFKEYEEIKVYSLDNGCHIISVIAAFEKAECIMTLTVAQDLHTVQTVKFQAIERTSEKGQGAVTIVVIILFSIVVIVIFQGRKKKPKQEIEENV